MVWFYGGAFFSGSGDVDLYNGEYLASFGDVLVISVNYRLGALGFLNSGSPEAPGNMGMYDQVMALNWIKNNIEAFGGDPENIVLFGQSAGATSAGLHLFSPLTRDIPSRVILQSGGPLFPKIYYENSIEKSSMFAVKTGCATHEDQLISSPSKVLKCLRDLDTASLVASHEPLFKKYKIPFFPHAGDEFLPDLPHEAILDAGNIGPQTEILVGNMEDEGSFFLHLFFPEVFKSNADIKNFNLTLDEAKEYVSQAYSFIPENQAQLMSQFFLMNLNEASKSEILKATHDIIGDSGFICPAVLLSEHLSDFNVSVYHYLFTERPSNTKWANWMGSTHMDEVDLCFWPPAPFTSKVTPQPKWTSAGGSSTHGLLLPKQGKITSGLLRSR